MVNNRVGKTKACVIRFCNIVNYIKIGKGLFFLLFLDSIVCLFINIWDEHRVIFFLIIFKGVCMIIKYMYNHHVHLII